MAPITCVSRPCDPPSHHGPANWSNLSNSITEDGAANGLHNISSSQLIIQSKKKGSSLCGFAEPSASSPAPAPRTPPYGAVSGVRLTSVTAFSMSPQPAAFPFSIQSSFRLWQPISMMWGSGWGPNMWDPQFLYLTLSLARLRPEVFPLLVPVLQNNVLAPCPCRPDKWLDFYKLAQNSWDYKMEEALPLQVLLGSSVVRAWRQSQRDSTPVREKLLCTM